MVHSVEQPAVPRFQTLVIIAILAGMATAALIVLLMAVHPAAMSRARIAKAPAQTGRPSPFTPADSASAPLDANAASPRIANADNRAAVLVTGYDSNARPLAQANGYVYSANGIIVTSYSAIRGASSVTIDAWNGNELNVIALMGYNPSRDLAVLAVLEGNLTALESGAGEPVQEGDWSTAIGPNGAMLQGRVGPRRAVGGVDLIQIDAQATPGSPVLNRNGKVIGLIVKRSAGVNAAFAIPTQYISDLLAEHRSMSFAQMLEETASARP